MLLANASLDTALHDKGFNNKKKDDKKEISISEKDKINNKNNEISEKDFVEQFFVGLLEGDGTITVDQCRNTVRVRIIISLKNEKMNESMLKKIQKVIGGRVVIEKKEKYVT